LIHKGPRSSKQLGHLPAPEVSEPFRCDGAVPQVLKVRIGVQLELVPVNFPKYFRRPQRLAATVNEDLVSYLRLILNSFAQ
jgi:hypothetical protein